MKPLIAGDLCIRPFREEDGPDFVAAILESVSTVGAWQPWCHGGYSIIEAEAWFGYCEGQMQAELSYDVGIFHTATGRLIGGVSINQINQDHNFGNVGYWVRQTEQRKGIAPRAAKMMCNFGFRVLRLTRLEIVAAESNLPSRRVAEKIGAVLECVARNRLMLHDQPIPAAIYSLVPEQIPMDSGSHAIMR
jgi:RimJ/RimL family protein N-acetyltransferase